METIKIMAEPRLAEPVAILGFSGWANAGEVSTSSITFLEEGLNTSPLAEILPDPYYDFTSQRPTARIKDGRVLSLNMPRNIFTYCEAGRHGPPTILFKGQEPHLNWNKYVNAVLKVLTRFGVKLVISLGGTYDELLHTDPAHISVIAEDMVLAAGLLDQGASPGRYSGPVSIHTLLFSACRDRGINVVSLWGHAPVYVQTGNFKLVLKMMDLIAALGGPKPNRGPLEEAGLDMENQIEALIEHSPKLAGYIERLKKSKEEQAKPRRYLPRRKGKVIPLGRGKQEDDEVDSP